MFFKQQIASDVENREGLKIVYDDVAPYAKENSRPQVISPGLRPRVKLHPEISIKPRKTVVKKEFPDLKRDDLVYPGYSLCVPHFALLDGKYVNFPDNALDYGYISDAVSGDNCKFSSVVSRPGLKPHTGSRPNCFVYPSSQAGIKMDTPELTILFNQKFTSVGLLITFNLMSGDYCTNIITKWFSGEEKLSEMTFAPDSERYFCNNYVRSYDKIVITFVETSRPLRPVFVTRIDYGIYRDFLGNELLDTSCLQEINSISENISINTLNFTTRTSTNIPFDFQKKQKLSLFFNGSRIGNFYLKNGAKKNRTDYYMDAHDAIGVLEGNEFPGGIYTGQTVDSVIDQIFAGENFNYLLDESLAGIELIGYIPYTSKHNALVQIAFAIGAVVDTSNYDGVLIYAQQKNVSCWFTENDTFEGVTLEHSDVVTGIRLSAHSWKKLDKVEELYNGELNGTADIIFSEPHHGLSITGGTLKKSGDNFATITGDGGTVVLSGKKYAHITSSVLKENPAIVFNRNIKEVRDGMLIHPGNAQGALERIYNYYQRAENVLGDVLLSNITIGQVVEIETGYDGKRTGTLERVNYQFSKREIRAEVLIHE